MTLLTVFYRIPQKGKARTLGKALDSEGQIGHFNGPDRGTVRTGD